MDLFSLTPILLATLGQWGLHHQLMEEFTESQQKLLWMLLFR
jgi:hypothetical protein